ncbi:MAG: polyhydroxyalkanoate synthesis regulator DNA-binding domain-containing protein, partial [Myxococcota bacterium]
RDRKRGAASGMDAADEADMITIKKYSNRRLYDTSESRYITLEELATKIRKGANARVVDAKSGEELTQAILTQIIIESRGAAKLLPAKMLTQLIRMEDDALAEFFGEYMASALTMYQRMRRAGRRLGPFNPLNAPFGGPNPMLQWLAAAYGWPGAASGQGDALPPVPEPTPEELEMGLVDEGAPHAPFDEIAEMRRELDELKALVRQSAGQASPEES